LGVVRVEYREEMTVPHAAESRRDSWPERGVVSWAERRKDAKATVSAPPPPRERWWRMGTEGSGAREEEVEVEVGPSWLSAPGGGGGEEISSRYERMEVRMAE
jgi:hypothetical protein